MRLTGRFTPLLKHMFHLPFRWDVTNRNHLGSLIDGEKAVSYPRFLDDPAISKLAANLDIASAWDELWNNLHHQGDVVEASYADGPCIDLVREITSLLTADGRSRH